MFLTILSQQGAPPPPVIVVATQKSGGSADAYWLRLLIQAELNTYKDKSHIALGGVELDCDVTVIRPIVRPDNSAKVLRKIEANITKVIAKAEILDLYDELNRGKNLKEALLEEFEEEE